jgi:CysZ protein
MKAIQLHINAIKIVADQLMKGHFLLYFLPGLLVSFFFMSFFTLIREGENAFSFLESVPLIGSFLAGFIKGTFGVLHYLILQFYIFFILAILSPFNTFLSEGLDAALTGKEYPFNFIQIIVDFLRMVGLVVMALTLQFFFMAIFWGFSWILGLSFLNTLVFALISAFFIGFSFYDYSLERYKAGIFSSLEFSLKNAWTTTLTGLLFLAIYSIPFIGLIFAPVLLTMVSTVVYLQKKQLILET